jgi:hypothetical protein
MATTEERLSTLEAHFDTLMEMLVNQLANMNERLGSLERSINEHFDGVCRRLDNIRIWLMALTGLAGVQLMVTVALAIAMSRLGR